MRKLSFVAMLLMFSLVFGLFACVSADAISDAIDMVEKSNAKIAATIEKADEKADKNPHQTQKIIDKTMAKTEKIADKMVEKAAKNGVKVEKEYEWYEIGDQLVYLDPCRVIGN